MRAWFRPQHRQCAAAAVPRSGPNCAPCGLAASLQQARALLLTRLQPLSRPPPAPLQAVATDHSSSQESRAEAAAQGSPEQHSAGEAARMLLRLQQVRTPAATLAPKPALRPVRPPAPPSAPSQPTVSRRGDGGGGGLVGLRWRGSSGTTGAQQAQQQQQAGAARSLQAPEQALQQQASGLGPPAEQAQESHEQHQGAALPADPPHGFSPVFGATARSDTKALAGAMTNCLSVHSRALVLARGQAGSYQAVKAIATARKMLRRVSPDALLLVQPTRRGGGSGSSFGLDVFYLGRGAAQPDGWTQQPSGDGAAAGEGAASGTHAGQQQPALHGAAEPGADSNTQLKRRRRGDRYYHVSAAVDAQHLSRMLVWLAPRAAGRATVLQVAGAPATAGALASVAAARRLSRQLYQEELAFVPEWELGARRHMLRLQVVRCAATPEGLQLVQQPLTGRRPAWRQLMRAERQLQEGPGAMASEGTGGLRTPDYGVFLPRSRQPRPQRHP